MNKRIIACIMSAVLILSITACGKDAKEFTAENITTGKRYENHEFNVAVVIDDDMYFEDEEALDDMTDSESSSTGTAFGDTMLNLFGFNGHVYEAYAMDLIPYKIVSVSTADFSRYVKIPESLFARISVGLIQSQLKEQYKNVHVYADEVEILGKKHTVIRYKYQVRDYFAYASELRLFKNGRILEITIFSTDETDTYRILENLESLE